MDDAERTPVGVGERVGVAEPARRLGDDVRRQRGAGRRLLARALRRTAESGLPCTSSMARKYSSPSWPTSMMRTTFG